MERTRLTRTVAPRLSVAVEHRPCRNILPPGGTIRRADCSAGADGRLPPRRLLDLAGRAHAAVQTGTDPEALHVTGLLDLLWSDPAGNSLDRSISQMEDAARLSERPAAALTDVAAAYLVRAERAQTPRDLLEAVEAAERALALEPRSEPARFTLALALDRLGVDGEAIAAWRAYLAVDGDSPWADEARVRLEALQGEGDDPAPASPAPDATASELARFAERRAMDARLLGWDTVLGEWGDAVLRDDRETATERLAFAGRLGEALERTGGDASLADAVRAIRAAGNDPIPLARAHRAYARGRAAFEEGSYAEAAAQLGAAADAAGSPPLELWAELYSGATMLQMRRGRDGERILRALIARADTLRHPALAAHARRTLQTALSRDGRYERSAELLPEIERLLARAGEWETLGAAQVMAGEAAGEMGDLASMHRWMHRGLTTLREHRDPLWLHNLLIVWADATGAEGLRLAALHLQDEGARAAAETGFDDVRAEARLARARLLAAAGEMERADADVAAARALVQRLDPGRIRDWLVADLSFTRALVRAESDPAAADTLFAPVVRYFATPENPARLLPALVARADARLRIGRTTDAEVDLERAMRLLDRQQAATRTASLRASTVEAARETVDRIVLLRIAAGDTAGALAYLERGRAAFAPAGTGARSAAGPPAAPPGEVAVVYALVADTLLAWTVQGARVRLARSDVDRGDVLRTVTRLRAALETGAEEPAVRDDLAALHDLLVRPVRDRLGPEGTPLVVVADGEIAAVPLAALFDRGRGRYLVEDRELRFAGSLRDAALSRPPADGAERTLLVADPAFPRRAYPGLERLSGAAAEVEAIANAAPGTSVVLSAADADRTAVADALRQASVVHYAGHAAFDDHHPGRSHLVLAAPSAAPDSARLSAAELEAMDLRHLRLVVLSACETTRPGAGRSLGFAGLAGAFVSAGAGGVVGSLWRVDDHLTRPLMVDFHRAYRASGDGAAALRAAQLRMLRSTDPAERSPAAWAAFQYVGS